MPGLDPTIWQPLHHPPPRPWWLLLLICRHVHHPRHHYHHRLITISEQGIKIIWHPQPNDNEHHTYKYPFQTSSLEASGRHWHQIDGVTPSLTFVDD